MPFEDTSAIRVGVVSVFCRETGKFLECLYVQYSKCLCVGWPFHYYTAAKMCCGIHMFQPNNHLCVFNVLSALCAGLEMLILAVMPLGRWRRKVAVLLAYK